MEGEEAVAIVAAAETERQEDAGDTAVQLAEINAESIDAANQAAVEIATVQADAAVEIAEAQANEVDEQWLRSEFASVHQQIADMSAAIATLATLSAPPLIPTPPPEPEPETVTVVEAMPPEGEADGPRESLAGEPPAAPPAKVRRRRWI